METAEQAAAQQGHQTAVTQVVGGTERKLTSTEILLFFNASRSGKMMIYVEPTDDEKVTNLFMITPAIWEAIKADRISDLTFKKQPQPIPPQNPEQEQLWAEGRRAFSWRPTGLTETELVALERESKLFTFKANIKKMKKELELA